MISFKEIHNTAINQFDDAMKIYLDSIPAHERQDITLIRERINNKIERMFIGFDSEEIVLVVLVFPIKNTDFILFDYMAVKENHRNKGIGSQFLEKIFEFKGLSDKIFIGEVEDPKYGKNRELRKRRVNFYRRNGAKILKNVNYLLPPLSGNDPTKMILMIFSKVKIDCLSGKLVKELIIQIYREVYSRDSKDNLLNSFINSIPSIIELE